MKNASENLKSVMDYFKITSSRLSKAVGVDPSLVSRWLKGQRQLKAASPVMDALAEYILAGCRRVRDIEWLKTEFIKAGLPVDISTVYRIKQNLVIWLASDGDILRQNLGGTLTESKTPSEADAPALSRAYENPVNIGCLDIALGLEPLLSGLPDGAGVDVYLSDDEIATMAETSFSRLLLHMIEKKKLFIRLVVCVSGHTKAVSSLISVYMQPLVSGRLKMFFVHGMTQTVTRQMHLIIPEKYVVLITETPDTAPPVTVIVSDEAFVKETTLSYERAIRFAQPVLSVYGDNYSRNILEILYMEYATPGSLDVVKDSINPMYMTHSAYDRVLRVQGHREEEFSWRSAEFVRFKTGMDAMLQSGTVFREILSLSRLNQIAQDGFCRMPGLYYMKQGFVNLCAQGCADILNGYIRYIEDIPNFHLLILDDLTMLQAQSCWHIKQNCSVGVNYWNGDEPLMIHSDQILLVQEFQNHFNSLWAQGEGCIGNRSGVIATLRNILGKLSERHKVNMRVD